MSKYYAVYKGHVPGVYTTYDESKKQTDGFSKAVHKSFERYDEALEFYRTGRVRRETPPADTVRITYRGRSAEFAIAGRIKTALDELGLLPRE